jgi:hypothetical protein
VIVQEVDVGCIAIVEAENDTPVGANCDRPASFEVAFKGMQLERWLVHILNAAGSVQKREYGPDALHHLRRQLALVVFLKEAAKALVTKTPDDDGV